MSDPRLDLPAALCRLPDTWTVLGVALVGETWCAACAAPDGLGRFVEFDQPEPFAVHEDTPDKALRTLGRALLFHGRHHAD